MSNESKPPMRQIAELIDGIATARAEDATALLRIAEMQAIEARLGEKAALETIADRDAQIARVKALLDSAISDCIDRDAEIARLKAALDSESTLRSCREEQLRLLHQDYAGCVRERNEARHEVETWQREYSGALADFEHAQEEIARLKAELAQAHRHLSKASAALHGAGFCERLGGEWDAPSPAPPADDPRIAALCDLAFALFQLKEHNCDDVSRSVRRTMSSKHVELLGGTPVRR